MRDRRPAPALVRRLLSRVRSIFTGSAADSSMREEMRLHMELQAEEYVKEGMKPDAAGDRARREFGHLDGLQETCRDERGFPWVSHLVQDLQYGLRMLARSPGFTFVAVLTLALGIGVNAGVFSLMDEILLKQLPVKDPSNLIIFRWASPKDFPVPVNGTFEPDPSTKFMTCSSFTTATFERFKAQGRPLDGVCAYCGLESSTVVVDGKAESIEQGQLVSGDYFSVLGVPPEIGRVIEGGDDRPGAQAVAMISYRYWVRRFGADPSVIGKSVTIDSSPVTIVGVTSSRFSGTLEVGDYPDIYLPLSFSEKMGRESLGRMKNGTTLWWLQILARPQPGTSREQVGAALQGVLRQAAVDSLDALKAQVPSSQGRELILIASPGGQGLTEIRNQYRQQLALLVALAGSILAIACANIANLLLARGMARQREIGVRLAMGAERGRIVRQLFTESALLAVLGGVLSVPLAYWTESFLVTLHPDIEGHTLQLHSVLDGRVFAAAAIIAGATALAFGLLPALRASSVDVTAEFQGGSNNRGGGSRSRLGKAFLVIQIALSLVLGHPIEVIGVVRDTGYDDLRRGSPPTAYFGFQFSEGMGSAKATFAVRVTGNTGAVATLIRDSLQKAYPLLPLANLRTQASQIEDLSANERMFARLSLLFSLLGVGLVSLGLYGLMSYSVLRRTSEIGLRMALGATPSSMVWMILRECLLVVAVGLGIGLAGAFASVRLLSSLLYGLSATDPLTFAAGVFALLGVGLVAGWLPARRAARLDPMIALRCD